MNGSAAVRLLVMSWQAQVVLPSFGLTVQGAAASAVWVGRGASGVEQRSVGGLWG